MKLEALEFAAQYGDGDAAFSFNTTRKTIRDWRKQEEVIKRIVGDGLGKKKRKEGGGRPIKHPELELLLPSWIKDKRRKEGSRVTVKQVQKRGNLILQEMGKEETVKYGAIWRMKERAGLSIRRRSTENQYKHDDLIPKCQRFCLYMKDLYHKHDFSQVVAMDETPLFSDNMGKTTLDERGAKQVRLRTTGNSKKMQTLVLSINLDGSKNLPCLVFKGKGKTPEGKQLQTRDDILVFFTDNGWMNDTVTEKWVGKIFPHESDEKKLLIWDSFKCHTDENIKGVLNHKNVLSAIIPGGCTSQIQTLDVCINRPFKSKMEDLFDEFMADESQHSFTRGGNMRAASMTQICNMVVRAWEDITPDIIIRSFKVCGQSPDTEVGDILVSGMV